MIRTSLVRIPQGIEFFTNSFFIPPIYFPYLIDWLQTENKNELFGEMVYEKPFLEGTREFLGLIISALVVTYLLFR